MDDLDLLMFSEQDNMVHPNHTRISASGNHSRTGEFINYVRPHFNELNQNSDFHIGDQDQYIHD